MKKIKKSIIYILLICFSIFSTIYIFNTIINSNLIRTNDICVMNGGGYLMDTEASYSWEEIKESGTLLPISTESSGVEQVYFNAAGWNFTFYNIIYDKIYVRSDGGITFSSLNTEILDYKGNLIYREIPKILSYNYDLVALLGTSPLIDPSIGGNVYYQFLSSPNRLVIEYSNMYTSGSELAGDFEVIFYQTGNIKFQYKNIKDVFSQPPIIGLDHGDGLNYNIYTPNLALESLAIKFTFDEMIEPNYRPNCEEDDEFSWAVTTIDTDKLESFYGPNWEGEFGLLQDPYIEDKMKIKISRVDENSTDWEFNYEIWDWINRFDSYTDSSGIDSLIYKKDPTTYNQHNLTNIIPLFLPNRTTLFLLRTNLTYNYDLVSSGTNEINWYESKTIGVHNCHVRIHALYTADGILNYMKVYWNNESSSGEKLVFRLESFKSIFAEPSSMNTQVDDEHWFYVRNINNSLMEADFGIDWEQLFGLPLNLFPDSKFKLKISQTYSNTTHWITNYSLWDCIDRDDSFNMPSTSNFSLSYLKNPFEYPETHLWEPIIPLILPSPAKIYTSYANLDSFYRDISGYSTATQYPPALFFYTGSGLQGKAVYNSNGYLRELNIEYHEWGASEIISVLSISHFSEGPIPSYVGISSGKTYSYGIYNSSSLVNYPSIYRRVNLTIDFVSGEDLYLESVLVLVNRSFLRDDGVWVDSIKPYPFFLEIRDINYIHPNSSKYINLPFFAFNEHGVPPLLFFELEIDWSDYLSALDKIYSTYYPMTIEPLINGLKITSTSIFQTTQSYTFTSEGLLDIFSLTYNREEFFTIRLNDFDYTIPSYDVLDPNQLFIPGYNQLLFVIVILLAIASLNWNLKEKLK